MKISYCGLFVKFFLSNTFAESSQHLSVPLNYVQDSNEV